MAASSKQPHLQPFILFGSQKEKKWAADEKIQIELKRQKEK